VRGAAILGRQPDRLRRVSDIIIIHPRQTLTAEDRPNRLERVIDQDRDGAPWDRRRASVLVARLEPGAEIVHRMTAGRAVFVHVADGAASLDGEDMSTGDVAAITDQRELAIRAWQASEVVLVDVEIMPGDAREPADDRR